MPPWLFLVRGPGLGRLLGTLGEPGGHSADAGDVPDGDGICGHPDVGGSTVAPGRRGGTGGGPSTRGSSTGACTGAPGGSARQSAGALGGRSGRSGRSGGSRPGSAAARCASRSRRTSAAGALCGLHCAPAQSRTAGAHQQGGDRQQDDSPVPASPASPVFPVPPVDRVSIVDAGQGAISVLCSEPTSGRLSEPFPLV